jgi:hypothetical protein
MATIQVYCGRLLWREELENPKPSGFPRLACITMPPEVGQQLRRDLPGGENARADGLRLWRNELLKFGGGAEGREANFLARVIREVG